MKRVWTPHREIFDCVMALCKKSGRMTGCGLGMDYIQISETRAKGQKREDHPGRDVISLSEVIKFLTTPDLRKLSSLQKGQKFRFAGQNWDREFVCEYKGRYVTLCNGFYGDFLDQEVTLVN